ncbi:MAG: GyrI-like domain-containing protein [Alphaproteobacteria bacterium]
MTQQIMIATVLPRTLAAVRAHVKMPDVPRAFKPALDKVWAYLAAHPGLRSDGHNVFLYHHVANPAEGMNVDFGVEVTRKFADEGDIICVETPHAEAAIIIHRGDYALMRQSHMALHAAVAASGRKIGAYSWEIYGDPTPDPAQTEVEIVYLLK